MSELIRYADYVDVRSSVARSQREAGIDQMEWDRPRRFGVGDWIMIGVGAIAFGAFIIHVLS